ncbi:MAG: hypothetical protein K9L30_11000 [Desulfobacterales bacterium]|nr:hypothetical protein [Desulfobacterales bacterium]
MKVKRKDITNGAIHALQKAFENIPFIEMIDIGFEASFGKNSSNLIFNLKLPDRIKKVIVEIKPNGQPRFAREAIDRIVQYNQKAPDSYGVFMAPYISSTTAKICRINNIGHMDLSGNCQIFFDNIYIEMSGQSNKYNEKRDLRSIFSPKSERVLRAMLHHPGKKWKVEELRDECNVSIGQVSNVKKQLSDREWLSVKRGSIHLTEPAKLIRKWASRYHLKLNKVLEFNTLKSARKIEQDLTDYCRVRKINYALTGFSGMAAADPSFHHMSAMMFMDEIPDDINIALSLKKVERGGTLTLLIPYDDGIYYGTQSYDGLNVVAPLQLYLDLKDLEGPGKVAAETIYKRIIDSWT